MQRNHRRLVTAFGLFALTALSSASFAQQAPADRVTAVKQWLGQSMASIRHYQWIETTVVSLKGEEKSRVVNSCYYDVTGALQKVPMSAPPAEEKKRGIRK